MLLKAYITYARPKLEFSTNVRNPGLKARRYNGLADKLERVQRLFTRRLFGTSYKNVATAGRLIVYVRN